jgi:hypothetical protein
MGGGEPGKGQRKTFWAWLVEFVGELKPAAVETTRRGKWFLLHFVDIKEAQVRLARADATARELENVEKALGILERLRAQGHQAWISQDGRLFVGPEAPSDQLALEVTKREQASAGVSAIEMHADTGDSDSPSPSCSSGST